MIYKGHELIKAINENLIPENTKIIVHKKGLLGDDDCEIYYRNGKLEWKPEDFNTGYLCDDSTFEIFDNNIKELPPVLIGYEHFNVKTVNDILANIAFKINEIIRKVNDYE